VPHLGMIFVDWSGKKGAREICKRGSLQEPCLFDMNSRKNNQLNAKVHGRGNLEKSETCKSSRRKVIQTIRGLSISQRGKSKGRVSEGGTEKNPAVGVEAPQKTNNFLWGRDR